MSSRLLSDLHPLMRPLVTAFLAGAAKRGVTLLVTCTYRDRAEQAMLYARGRTSPGKIVTHAKPGQSMHNFTIRGKPAAKAVDVVPIWAGKPVWLASDPLWLMAGEAGEAAGLEWAGRWRKSKREYPHFQMRAENTSQGSSLAPLRRA